MARGLLIAHHCFNLSLICQAVFVHDFGMLFLVLEMLWLKICSLCYRRIV